MTDYDGSRHRDEHLAVPECVLIHARRGSHTVDVMLRRDLLLTIYALSLLSVLSFALAEGSLPLAAIGFLTTIIAWRLGSSGRPAMPRWVVNAGVLFASLFLFWEIVVQRQENLLQGLGHFLIAVQICKLFDLRNRRDNAQAAIVSMLIMITAAIITSSAGFGIMFFIYLMLVTHYILLASLHGPGETGFADSARLMRRDIRRAFGGTFLMLICCGVIIFVTFPRGSRQPFAAWMANRGILQTGFTQNVHLGDFGQLQRNETVVMHVRIEQNGRPIGSEDFQPYFRGGTLDLYDSQRGSWQRSRYIGRQIADIAIDAGQVVDVRAPSSVPRIRQYYTMMINTGNTLFAVEPLFSLSSETPRRIAYCQADGTITIQAPTTEGLQYMADSAITTTMMDIPTITGDSGRYDLYRPAISLPDIIPIARQAGGNLFPAENEKLGRLRAEALVGRFDDFLKNNYPYSLQIRTVDPKIDRIVDFLKNRRKIGGHCEYFASALIMMCRSAGLQARMVTGYHGGEYNSVGGFYVVRQKYAHAWVEVLIPDRGWVHFDPSPSSPDSSAEPNSLSLGLRWLREITQVIERNWLNGVISFDNSTREYLAQIFVHPFVAAYESASQWTARQLRIVKNDPGLASIQLLVALCLIGAGSAGLILLFSVVRTSDSSGNSKSAQRIHEFVRLLEHHFRQKRLAHQTLHEYADTLALPAQTLRAVTSAITLLESSRYGPTSWTNTQDDALKQQITTIRRNLNSTKTPE